MFEHFSERARKIMALANQEAQRFNHEYIASQHIFLGILAEGNNVAVKVLEAMGVDLGKARREIESIVKCGEDSVVHGKLPQTPDAKRVVESAIAEAQAMGHHHVGSEHLLLGILSAPEGIATVILLKYGVTLARARIEVAKIVGSGESSGRPASESRSSREAAAPSLQEALRRVIRTFDPQVKRLQEEKDACVREADYARAAELRDHANDIISTKALALRTLMEGDPKLLAAVLMALAQTDGKDRLTTGRLLLGLIKSDDELSRRLAPAMDMINAACEASRGKV